MSTEREEFVDRFVEEGLARYSDAEPRRGLEQRVLANLRAQPKKRPWWVWLPAPVAAALLVGLVLWLTRPQPRPPMVVERTPSAPVVSPRISSSQTAPEPVAKRRPLRAAHAQARIAVAQRRNGPRQPVFPSPAPMSEQERLLLAFVKQHPDEAQAVVREQEEWRKAVEEMFTRNNQ